MKAKNGRVYKYAIVYPAIGWTDARIFGSYRVSSRHNTLRGAVMTDCAEDRRVKKACGPNSWRDQKVWSWDADKEMYQPLTAQDAEKQLVLDYEFTFEGARK